MFKSHYSITNGAQGGASSNLMGVNSLYIGAKSSIDWGYDPLWIFPFSHGVRDRNFTAPCGKESLFFFIVVNTRCSWRVHLAIVPHLLIFRFLCEPAHWWHMKLLLNVTWETEVVQGSPLHIPEPDYHRGKQAHIGGTLRWSFIIYGQTSRSNFANIFLGFGIGLLDRPRPLRLVIIKSHHYIS